MLQDEFEILEFLNNGVAPDTLNNKTAPKGKKRTLKLTEGKDPKHAVTQ